MQRLTNLLRTLGLSFLFGLTVADFSLWHLHQDSMSTPYIVWDGSPSCDMIDQSVYFYPSGDVSGDKTGVRCESEDMNTQGDCIFASDPSDIDIVEMNFHSTDPTWHWTTYKNVGYPLVGLDDSVWGTCSPPTVPQPEFYCGYSYAYRILHCVGDQPGRTLPSAAEINQLIKS
ncbi:hypothetical protein V8F33_010641 [Rhypophila sp. PSN 637]